MKTIIRITAAVIVLCSVASAQNWKGWFVGASADVFWDQPAEKMFTQPRVQVSKVFQVGSDPNIFSLPGLSWRSSVGEVNVELLNIYHQFYSHGKWRFFSGAGVAPLVINTESGGSIADKAAVGIDLAATYGISSRFGLAAGLKVDWQAPYNETEEAQTVVTFTIGTISDFLGF